MAIARSRVTVRGRTSIPSEIRQKLGIGPGSIIEWTEEGGNIVVRRTGRFSSEDVHRMLFGTRAPKVRSSEEMKEGIRRYMRKRYARR